MKGIKVQLNYRYIYRHVCIVLILCVLIAMGCSPKEHVKVDLNSFLQNQEGYQNKDVIFTATLSDVIERYQLYRDKKIEVTAPVSYYGSRGYWTWYLMLGKDTLSLRCYTHYYRLTPDYLAIDLLGWARNEHGEVTVEGILRKDGLELETIKYNGQQVRTNVRTGFYPFFWWYY
ncbi:MAG: hypothetical protein WCQ99_06575 [Pseudomonadota bacterium]